MITDELNGLLKEYDFKKDVLDNHTKDITAEIREWCLAENERINHEYDSLKEFFTKNIHLGKFNGMFHSERGLYTWSGLQLGYKLDDDGKFESVVSVALSMDWKYKRNFGTTWSKLPKVENEYRFYGDKLDVRNTELDYWMDYKRLIAIRNEELTEVAKLTKDLIGTMILKEKNRCEEMVKAVKDIENDTSTEITIVVR